MSAFLSKSPWQNPDCPSFYALSGVPDRYVLQVELHEQAISILREKFRSPERYVTTHAGYVIIVNIPCPFHVHCKGV
jgi:hypothetical protein